MRQWGGIFLLVVGVSAAHPVRADERWLGSLDADVALAVSQPQRDLFGPGAMFALTGYRTFVPWLAFGIRLRAGFLSEGDSLNVPTLKDPGIGTLYTASGVFRVRPTSRVDLTRRANGLWIDIGGGGGLTGDFGRAMLEAGLGYNFAVGNMALGPAVRYIHMFQPNGNLGGADADLITAGLSWVFGDKPRREEPAPPPPEPEVEPPSDRDGDGIADPDDECPDEPEDPDGYEDTDGCPENDNDGDGLLDPDDECPNQPEDKDGFEDTDGCPDPDNDGDGVPDEKDQCPAEPEVLNGVDDDDGCPDEGVIEMVDNRIVLDETVIFDFGRARVRSRAKPVIRAIVNLVRAHPEWKRLRVEGHADARGPEQLNLNLSSRRARNVMKALIEAGISSAIIEAKGFGSSQPRDLRKTEQAYQRNRRVEFVVIMDDEEQEVAP